MEIKRPYTTVNTFTRRPCLNQIFSYLILILDNLSFWLTIQNHYTSDITRYTMATLFAISVLLLLIFGCLTSTYDPADPIMTQFRNGNDNNLQTDQLCLYCDHCQSYVLTTSKHCKLCDRCVDKFDHHCIWINHCIGRNNYKIFIGMILTAQIHLTLYIAGVGLLWNEGGWNNFLIEMILNWIIFAIVILFSIMLLALIILHFYLIAHNTTTFQFMINRRNAQINPSKQPVKEIPVLSNHKHKESNVTQNNPGEDIYKSTQFLQETPFKTMEKDGSKEEEQPSQQFKESRLDIIRTLQPIRAKSEMDRRTDLEIQTGEDMLKGNKALKMLIGNGLKIKSMRNSRSYKNLKKEKQVSISNRSEDKDSELGVKLNGKFQNINEKFQNINVIFQQ